MAEEQKTDQDMNQVPGTPVEQVPSSEQVEPAASQSPQTPPSVEAPRVSPPQRGGGGKKIFFVLVVLVLLSLVAVVLGVVMGRRAQLSRQTQEQQERVVPTQEVMEDDALTKQYESQSTSDEVSDIEADLQSTTFQGIDAELGEIDKELSSQE